MDLSTILPGRHATASQCGSLLATSIDNKIRIHFAYAPERYLELVCGVLTKDVTSIKWSPNSALVSVASHAKIQVLDLNDANYRCNIDNGSGGLGRFIAAEFVDNDHIMTAWEFGKLKVWNLQNNRAFDLADAKTTCKGPSRIRRPTSRKASGMQTMAILSRIGAEDFLTIAFPTAMQSTQSVKLSTIDAQSLSWSPDGRWLAVLDTPTSSMELHVLTPECQLFRTWPSPAANEPSGLRTKSLRWSTDSSRLALSHFDGKITLLNTTTFTPLAVVEHTTTIDQHHLPSHRQATIWRETVSAAYERTYTIESHPISPSLSQPKPNPEPHELGVAECSFSSSGAYLATRDERMQSTIWLWNVAGQVRLHAVILQHNNIKRMCWHPSGREMLLMEGSDGVCYLYSIADDNNDTPPLATTISLDITAQTFLATPANSPPVILAHGKPGFRLVYPEGRPEAIHENRLATSDLDGDHVLDEGASEAASEDSIFQILSGRKPMPSKTEFSYTERIDLESAATDQDFSDRLDDTFRDKQFGYHGNRARESRVEIDPLDDSQIF